MLHCVKLKPLQNKKILRFSSKTIKDDFYRLRCLSSQASMQEQAGVRLESNNKPNANDASPKPGFFDPKRITISDNVPESELKRYRWRLIPFSFLNHLSLGSIFAWGAFNKPLMELHGIVGIHICN